MPLPPVAERELRLAARRPRTYYLRMAAAGVAFLIVAYVTGNSLGQSGGRSLFAGLCWGTSWMCMFGGAAVTADAISRERREGTLGFLFLSHLSGFDVVLGKFLANAAYAFCALLAIVPVLAIPVLDGGVQPGEFWFEMLALANTLFFSVCLGLLTSSVTVDARQAVNVAATAALLFWFGLRGLAALVEWLEWPAWIGATLACLSPASAQGMSNAVPISAARPWLPLLVTHLLAWLFLFAAADLTRRAWREKPACAARSRLRNRWRDFTLGPRPKRDSRRRAMLDRNAFYWFASRHRFKPLWPLLLVLAIGGPVMGVWWYERDTFMVLVAGLLALHILLKFWVAAEAVAPIVAHRREGTLELLLSTPLSVRDIVRGQFLAARRQFLLPVLLTAVLTLLAAPLQVPRRDADPWLVVLALAGVVTLLADVFTLVWLGTWKAIASRRVRHAAGNAILMVLFVPWLVLMLLAPGTLWKGEPVSFFFFWFFTGMVSDFLWWQWARQHLFSEFRVRAEGASSPNPPGWLDRITST